MGLLASSLLGSADEGLGEVLLVEGTAAAGACDDVWGSRTTAGANGKAVGSSSLLSFGAGLRFLYQTKAQAVSSDTGFFEIRTF